MHLDELRAWLRLTTTPGLSRAAARRLLAAFGAAEAAAQGIDASHPSIAQRVDLTRRWLCDAPEGVARAVVPLGSSDYPPPLLEIEDPPLVLYIEGRIETWREACAGGMLAVVGTRRPTPQGSRDAQAFAREFVQRGIPVVSGLALGIDAAAHEGALAGAGTDASCATVAVVGTGLDIVYPARHAALAARIAARGLLVSEYPLGSPPLAHHFPQRNRILSGLARGTLVVEAALKSGSLITARVASEQGREVFAVPGSIHAPQSRGCHWLIRQGAKLVEAVEDLLEELPGLGSAPTQPAAMEAPKPSPRAGEADTPLALESPKDVTRDASGLLAQLGWGPMSLDGLIARTGIAAPALQARLLELELEGRLARLPGGFFQRLDRG